MAIWTPCLRRSMPSRVTVTKFCAYTSNLGPASGAIYTSFVQVSNISLPEQEVAKYVGPLYNTSQPVKPAESAFINLNPRNLVPRYDRISVTRSRMRDKRTSCSDIHSHNVEPKSSTSVIFNPSPQMKNDSTSQNDHQV